MLEGSVSIDMRAVQSLILLRPPINPCVSLGYQDAQGPKDRQLGSANCLDLPRDLLPFIAIAS